MEVYRGDSLGEPNGPKINIETKKYGEEGRYSYVMQFEDKYAVESTITVKPCMDDMDLSMFGTASTSAIYTNQFVPSGFSSEGYEGGYGKYVLDVVNGMAENAFFNAEAVHNAWGYVNVVYEVLVDVSEDYDEGVAAAITVENATNAGYVNDMYSSLGFWCCPVEYDTTENNVTELYVQPGTKTTELIQQHNQNTEQNLSIYGILQNPQENAIDIAEYYGHIQPSVIDVLPDTMESTIN